MSDYVTMTVFGSTYDNVDAAEADYDAVKALDYDLGLMDSFDAAVLFKKDTGKVKIVDRNGENATVRTASPRSSQSLSSATASAKLKRPPDPAQIKSPGGRRWRISTTFETRP